MDIDKLKTMFAEKVTQWEQSQKDQTSGYQYEKSFVEMMNKLEQEVFKHITTGEERGGEKKTFDHSGSFNIIG